MINPLVSVIIPVYNGSNYLKSAIDSALSQTYENIEVLVINDGSSDGGATENIALSYKDKVRYLSKANGGVATALNLGIREMKGEYFSWLSHDDMYYPTKIEKQINALIDSGDLKRIVYSDYDLLDVASDMITHAKLDDTYSSEQLENSVFSVLLQLIHGCSLLIHKSHFERVGTFDEKLQTTQDYDLWFQMFRDQRQLYIPENLILSRVHSQQGSKTIACHNSERDLLYLGYIKALTEDEIISMYGSMYRFYNKICFFLKGAKLEKSHKYVIEKISEQPVPEGISKGIAELHKYIGSLSGGKARKICIFCAGQYGTSLFEELQARLIKVDFFSDNDAKKTGYITGNTYCITLEDLLPQKDDTLVIIATRTPAAIVEQLENLQFPYVTTKQELDKRLLDVPAFKWLNYFDAIDDIDYSSPQIRALVDRFKQTIFEICRYYEDRV